MRWISGTWAQGHSFNAHVGRGAEVLDPRELETEVLDPVSSTASQPLWSSSVSSKKLICYQKQGSISNLLMLTNCPKTSLLKTTFIISQFLWVKHLNVIYLGVSESGCQLGLDLLPRSLVWLLAGFSCTWAVGLRALVYYWVLARSLSQLLTTGAPRWQPTSIRASKQESERGQERWKPALAFCKHSLPSFWLHSICLLGPAHVQGVGITQGHEYQKTKMIGSHPKSFSTHGSSSGPKCSHPGVGLLDLEHGGRQGRSLLTKDPKL